MVAAQQVELQINEIWRIAELVRLFNEVDAQGLTKGSKLQGFLPVIIGGGIDASGVFHSGRVGIDGLTIPDQDSKNVSRALMADHARRLVVQDTRWWDWTPSGRIVLEDRFGGSLAWTASGTGTIALNTTRPYPGNTNNLGLSPLLNATETATIQLFRLADAFGRPNGPKIYFEVWFKIRDANANFFEIGLQLNDGVRQMIARIRHAIPSGITTVLDSAGGQTVIGSTYLIPTSEGWHRIAMELFYQSGAATLQYVSGRIDDQDINAANIPALNNAAATTNFTLVELTADSVAGAGTTIDVGLVLIKDLTNVRAIIGSAV